MPSTSSAKEIQTQVYQRLLWHKQCAELLPVVVIFKTHLHTHKTAHVVRCSRAVTLGEDLLIDYYRRRFHRECTLRDAQPYWGREDVMHVNARPVSHGAHLAMCMVNVSQALMRPMRAQWAAFSVHDLKAWFRGQTYVVETLQLLPEPPDPIVIAQVVSKMAELGRVHHAVNSV